MLRAAVFLLLLACTARGATAAPMDRVTVPDAKTFVYVATVQLKLAELVRGADSFTADYEAKVVPWFFYDEAGQVTVQISPEEFAALARAEEVRLAGEAVNDKGRRHRLGARATPHDATGGALKVSLWYGKTQLVFRTSYRFTGDADEPESAAGEPAAPATPAAPPEPSARPEK